jgi:hypothetical protein
LCPIYMPEGQENNATLLQYYKEVSIHMPPWYKQPSHFQYRQLWFKNAIILVVQYVLHIILNILILTIWRVCQSLHSLLLSIVLNVECHTGSNPTVRTWSS